jgi:hypothetical protein
MLPIAGSKALYQIGYRTPGGGSQNNVRRIANAIAAQRRL